MKAVSFFSVAFALVTTAVGSDRPNILFIMSDDHTAQAVGAYATLLKPLNPTPNIDKLSDGGMVFDNAFVTNSICTPSRACIMTGQYNHTNGVFDLDGRLPPERQTLAIKMREAGYQTAVIGKWHLASEPNFDFYHVLPGQGDYMSPTYIIQGEKPYPANTVKYEEQHESDVVTDVALDWLRDKRDPQKPFFLCYQFKAPHDMFKNAPRYDTYLEDATIPEPETLWKMPDDWGSIATRGHNDELVPHIGTSIGRRNPRRNYTRNWAKDPSLDDEAAKRLAYQTYLKKYLRCVKGVDDNVGRVLAYLKEAGLHENTLIIYTGDQGFWLGEKDYQDKRWAYDVSQRMPFIVHYPPAIKPGSRSHAIIENIDFPALMLDYAGVKIPESFQGRSFRSICETGKVPADWKQAAYYRYWMHMAHHDNPAQMAIRTKTHKLIYFYGCDYEGKNQTPPGWELYDLKKDPEELHNLYDDPAHAAIRDRLKAQFAELRDKVGDNGTHHPACEKVVREFWDYSDGDRSRAVEISREFREQRERSLRQ